ncbi:MULTISPECIES: complex I subunit 4 family protein [Thermodesulfovibrio]|jgi:NADH-quinone oxidoreductase subunit M|uniref:complex I subunit 4 family protein n=1 Tax=Thermodesulfovibrio TaxID=28261 RepID=UPI00261A4A2B|nr:NADH-quinone oxidoreductase subunit M [Thermodesulfovibrio sp.]
MGQAYLTVLIPLIGALVLVIVKNQSFQRAFAVLTSLLTLILSLFQYTSLDRANKGFQLLWEHLWIPSWNLSISFGFDELNAPFVLLTSFITLISVLLSLRTIENNIGKYLALLLLLSASVNAYFLSTNFLFFFFFYEAMLIPSVLLIKLWGGRKASEAAMKFLIYTFGFSIFLFASILAVYIFGGGFSFDSLYNLRLTSESKMLIFMGFVLAFAVKIPIVPFHGWLRDAYYEAPMAITIFLSAVLGKMGLYGLIRVSPAFYQQILAYGDWLVGLCIFSFVYAAFLALFERDLKAMFAYMSLSHVGIIAAGVFTGNILGFQGSLLQSINHGILSAAFFYVAELLYRNTKSFDVERFGALSKKVPAMTFFAFAYLMAMGGFPGMNYFNGELLLLSGIFNKNTLLGFIGVFGVAVGVVYLSWYFYRIFLRKPGKELSTLVRDVRSWELVIFSILFVLSIYLGLNPDFILSGVRELTLFGGRG